MSFILSIDQGTTQTKCIIMDKNKQIIKRSSAEFPQYYPKIGWVEHLNSDIKNSVKKVISDCILKANIDPAEIKAIGITNQRETTCLFDENGHSPLPFIVWQCRRSDEICLEKNDLSKKLLNITGLRLDPYFSASKLFWIFENYPELYKKAKDKKIMFGTIDSFLAHWFSGGDLHITDITNASRTMLMDLGSGNYSDIALDIFNVPYACLPKIVKNIGPYGYTKGLGFLPDGIPIASLIGDQQSALIAQTSTKVGGAKLTLGTGAFILANIQKKPENVKNGLLCSVAYQIDEEIHYCLEGSAFCAGASIQFLRDNLGFAKTYEKIDRLSESVKDSQEVSFIPALCGLGTPYWQPHARGAFLGLTRATQKAHMAKAVLESIALQNAEIFLAINNESKIEFLKIDGGMAKSHTVMQMHADFLGVECIQDDEEEKTAIGAALLAGLAVNMFKSFEEKISNNNKIAFSPKITADERLERIKKYKRLAKVISLI